MCNLVPRVSLLTPPPPHRDPGNEVAECALLSESVIARTARFCKRPCRVTIGGSLCVFAVFHFVPQFSTSPKCFDTD